MSGQSLQETLGSCSLNELLLLLSQVLAISGYGDVQILERRLPNQKSRLGGHELACTVQLGRHSVKTVVKVIRDSINHRMLDELTTVVPRMNADFGILFSKRPLSKLAIKEAPFYRRHHVTAMDAVELAGLLRKHSIGVSKSGAVDTAFFRKLKERSEREIACSKEGKHA